LFSGSAHLADAYRATDYVVSMNGHDVAICPGRRCHTVDKALARHKAQTAVFITAWNPYSKARGRVTNGIAHRKLVSCVRRKKAPLVVGEGRGTQNDWEPEQSVLVFGLSRSEAAGLGRQFRQNAVVFLRLGRPAELLFLR
jgi:hypothetical protein